MRRFISSCLAWLCALVTSPAASAAAPEAVVVVFGDSHSAYERMPQLVAHLDRLKADNRHVPLAVLVDGDTFESGNVVARRSGAEVDYAFLAALVKRAPVILNLGNHETDFDDPVAAVKKLQAVGVTVISGNGRNRATGQPLAPASTVLKLGTYSATVVGVMTDRLATFRRAVQPQLDLGDPVVWARRNFPQVLKDTLLPVVLSHAGRRADREMFSLVPEGTLFAGAHDHLRLVQPFPKGVYFQSGSWLECVSVARLRRTGTRLSWDVTQEPLDPAGPEDPELAALVRRVRASHLTSEDKVVVARLARAWPVAQAAEFASRAVADAAGVAVAFVGNTTFGAGLPADEVAQVDFDACVRFDGAIFTAFIQGDRLQRLLEASNPAGVARLSQDTGEFNYSGGRPGSIDPNLAYRIATTDWGAKNSAQYFGEPALEWEEKPGLKLKAVVLAALAKVK